MILINEEIRDLIERGVVCNTKDEHVNGSSLDVTLGSVLYVERPPNPRSVQPVENTPVARVGDPQNFQRESIISYRLKPGAFVLAATEQVFFLPRDISAEFRLKSTIARLGINQMLAVWCDPGWTNSTLTLELKNENQFHSVELTAGMRIGQMIFHRHQKISRVASYALHGKYNNQTEPAVARERKI